jgi:3-oxoacyl-[acyl-carrier protein] reductase
LRFQEVEQLANSNKLSHNKQLCGFHRGRAVSTLEDLDLTLDANVRGVFLAIQASVARMHDGGRVVTIGSNSAVGTGAQGSRVCAMTKAAVGTMVKGIALDLAPRQITVNNVQPGPTRPT